jgi:hypothetical protein
LPEPSNVYEFAAQFMLKYEKRIREKKMKQNEILEYNAEALRANSNRKSETINVTPGRLKM